MEKYTVAGGPLSVGSGEILALTSAQLATRRHNVEVLAGEGGKTGLTKVRAINLLAFKEGEVVHLDRVPKGNAVAGAAKPVAKRAKESKEPKRDANGDTPEMAEMRNQFDRAYAEIKRQLDTARSDGVAAGRAAMLAEIETRNAVFEAADQAEQERSKAKAALDAESDADKRKPLQAALKASEEALAKAEKAVTDLPELKA